MGYVRRNFLVPVPSFQSFDALKCPPGARSVWVGWTPGSGATMRPSASGWSGDLEALLPLPAVPYDACDKQASRVSSLSLVSFFGDYIPPFFTVMRPPWARVI